MRGVSNKHCLLTFFIDVGVELTGKQIKTGIVLIAPDKSSSDIDIGVELTGKQIKTGIVLIAPDKSSSDIDVGAELTGKQIKQVLYS